MSTLRLLQSRATQAYCCSMQPENGMPYDDAHRNIQLPRRVRRSGISLCNKFQINTLVSSQDLRHERI